MSTFKPGDKVLVNGNQVAEIDTYDEDKNRVVYVLSQGGSTNRVFDHISTTDIRPLVPLDEVEDEFSDEPTEGDDDGTDGVLVDA